MDNSILSSVKKVLGIMDAYDYYDLDIIMHINTVFSILTQLGVGPKNGFAIHDANDLWTDYLPNSVKLEMVKTYMYAKVRLIFDPPSSSAGISAIENLISELEWRLNVAVDPGEKEE